MKRRAISGKMRFEILKRDGFKCRYCGRGEADGAKLHVDHVIPVAAGGRNDSENLAAACAECNLGKRANLLSDPKIIGIDFEKQKEIFEAANASLDRYKAYLAEREEFEQRLAQTLAEPLIQICDPPRSWPQQVNRFFVQLGAATVREAAEVAVSRVDMRAVRRADAFAYFCGICWKAIRRQEGEAAP